MKNLIFLFTAVLLVTAGCRKDSDSVDTNIIFPEPGIFVETTIGGKVTNEAGNPVIGASVFLGSETAKTDYNGFFLFTNITVPENNAYIRVEHPSYFHGSRTIKVSAATRNKVAIQLLSNKPTQFVDAASGGTADYGDYSVKLPANGIVVASTGAAYSGQVGVAAKWLDPTSDDFGIQMPGQLAGIRNDGNFTGMISKGMLAVELSDANGARLQIREGYEATIKIKVDNALLDDAPAEIPLWHFDEKSGLWMEEGSAELKNGFYEGNVKHFSFWNCDVPADYIYLTVKVQDLNGNPLPEAEVRLVVLQGGDARSGYTDNTGEVSGLVPKNVQFNAKVYLPATNCPDPFHEQLIGPFTANNMITLSVNNQIFDYTYTVSGSLIDCLGQPVTTGYVDIPAFGQQYMVDNQGHFEITRFACQPINSINITGYNYSLLQSSASTVASLTPGNNAIGTIPVCNNLVNYISHSFEGTQIFYEAPSCYLSNDTLILTITNPVAQKHYKFETGNIISGPGTYTIKNFYASAVLNGEEYSHTCYWATCSGLTLNITQYSGPGNPVAGNYSGTLTQYTSQGQSEVSVTGSFDTVLQ